MLVSCTAVFFLTLALTWFYRWAAGRFNFVDTPNERSAHSTLVPRGGGVGLLASLFIVLAWPRNGSLVMLSPWTELGGIVLILLLIGWVDDNRGLSVKLRLSLYATCCVVAGRLICPSQGGWFVLILAIYLLWSLNSFNFMDGIDGLAGQQVIFVCLSAVLLSSVVGQGSGFVVELSLLMACATAGFLFFNWPPASLFMGDTGSVPLGFLLSALSLLYATQGLLNLYSWLILMGVFMVDTAATIGWRLLHRQQITQAHNGHAYQRLARRWDSHARVLYLVIAINVLWLLPLASVAALNRDMAPLLLFFAYAPLLLATGEAYKLP